MNQLIDFDYLHQFFSRYQLNHIEGEIIKACKQRLERHHGDVHKWQKALNDLPNISNAQLSISNSHIHLTGQTKQDKTSITQTLKQLCPWRKGPFNFLDVPIQTEWNSLLKWQRVVELNYDFNKKNIIDIGCGNGAFMWPLATTQAKSIVGVDPMWLFYHQFMVFQRYLKLEKLCFLPLGVEHLPLKNSFDTALSMGVLYHRKSPLDHLIQLKKLLKAGGDLILETITLADDNHQLLTPKNRYAGMRNVWMVPTVNILIDWVEKVGFEVVCVTQPVKTTLVEQSQTEWMDFHSLNQFLDEKDPSLTIEGLPAPYRTIILAKNKYI